MGRKGVSKRKPSKSKDLTVSKTNIASPISSGQLSETLAPKMVNKGDAISISMGKKKKKR